MEAWQRKKGAAKRTSCTLGTIRDMLPRSAGLPQKPTKSPGVSLGEVARWGFWLHCANAPKKAPALFPCPKASAGVPYERERFMVTRKPLVGVLSGLTGAQPDLGVLAFPASLDCLATRAVLR